MRNRLRRWTPTLLAIATLHALFPPLAHAQPPPRHKPTMVVDASRDRVLIFGGLNGASGFADVWQHPASPSGTWTRVETRGPGPAPRYGHTAIYDPLRDRMIVFGGDAPGLGPRNDTWELLLSFGPIWRRMSPWGTPPSPRFGHTAVYDPEGHRMIVFGGFGGSFEQDVWILSLGTIPSWSRLHPRGELPARRNAHVAVYDPVRHRMVAHGGFDGSRALDETWVLQLRRTPYWLRQSDPAAPTPRRQHAAALDAAGDRMLIFGGTVDGSSAAIDEAWAWSLAGRGWTRLSAEGAPPGRWGPAIGFHRARGGLLVFGGVDRRRWWNDTYWLDLGSEPRWVAVEPAR